MLKEPLFHFVVLGFLLFLAGRSYQTRTDIYRIEVTPAHVAQLSRSYALQFGTPPDPATLEQLIETDLHDEMLFRQGRALKLDQDDEIVRRRVVQKEQFLMQNLHAPAEPTDAQLQAYYAAHADHYAAPSRAAFSHIFFAVGPDGDAAAQARAKAVLAKIPAGVTRAPERGDAFPDLYDFSAFEPEQVERLFGHTDFSGAVFTAPAGRWSGPYRSAYGWHLLYVANRDAPTRPPLADVRDRVRSDDLQDAQDGANTAAFDQIAKRFTIVRADRKAAP
ncbi:peptidylprolyl isomerase [Phenylobacterium sp.]|uniref:peptidylprolyl isomerase n=1 Tax=Phenylobacterium sp. TaxID=1871053 RepID=UPI002E32DFFC|nr:peptidyl-prolyl cis-trans isomerase [Phenylobacterium sp.]HEX3365392.1 peptidyl-prolyl cis-trans isomerase [Phenylobacterium sp.]